MFTLHYTLLLGAVHCLDSGEGVSSSSDPSVHYNKNRADETNHWDPSGRCCLLGWASFGDQRTLVEVIHSEADRPISSIMERVLRVHGAMGRSVEPSNLQDMREPDYFTLWRKKESRC